MPEHQSKADRVVRPRLTAQEAECLYSLVAYFDEEGPGCDIYEWLGGAERVEAARRGAAKLRRSVYGPPQRDDEEQVEARYQARRAALRAKRAWTAYEAIRQGLGGADE